MSKPIISALWRTGIALGAALMALPSWAREVEVSPLVYEVDDEALTATVKEPLSNLRGIVEVPETITSGGKNYVVTGIGDGAFANLYYLTEVQLPSSITSIGAKAFNGNRSMERLEIPDGVTEITSDIFGENTIRELVIGTGLKEVPEGTFTKCESITKIIIKDSEEPLRISVRVGGTWDPDPYPLREVYMGRTCVGGFGTKLTSCIIGDLVTEINGIAGSMDELRLGKAVERINDNALSNLKFNRLYINDNLKYFGKNVLSKCCVPENGGIPSYPDLHIGSLETWFGIEFGDKPFDGNDLYVGGEVLRYLQIPEFVTKINPYAFQDYKNLELVHMTDNVTEIGDFAFAGTPLYNNVTWSKNLKKIGKAAFRTTRMSKLELPEGIEEIGEYAFAYNNIEGGSFRLTAGVVGEYAFYDSKFNELVIAPNVTQIGDMAFDLKGYTTSNTKCPIKKLIIEDGDEYLYFSDKAFDSEDNDFIDIEEIYLGRSTSCAFYNYRFLNKLTIGDKVTSVSGFDISLALKHITIPQSVQYLSGFYRSALTSMTILDSPDPITIDRFCDYPDFEGTQAHFTSLHIGRNIVPGPNVGYLERETLLPTSGYIGIGRYVTELHTTFPDYSMVWCYCYDPPKKMYSDPQGGNVHSYIHVPEGRFRAYRNNDEWGIYTSLNDDLPLILPEAIVLPEEIRGERTGSYQFTDVISNETFDIQGPIPALIWTSSDENVATVSPSGLVTFHNAGQCVVKATSAVDESICAECKVIVDPIYISGIRFNVVAPGPGDSSMSRFETLDSEPAYFSIEVFPVENDDDLKIEFSDPDVTFTCNSNIYTDDYGMRHHTYGINAHNLTPGKLTIKATSVNNPDITGDAEIEVKRGVAVVLVYANDYLIGYDGDPEKLSADDRALFNDLVFCSPQFYNGDKVTVSAKVLPDDAAYKDVYISLVGSLYPPESAYYNPIFINHFDNSGYIIIDSSAFGTTYLTASTNQEGWSTTPLSVKTVLHNPSKATPTGIFASDQSYGKLNGRNYIIRVGESIQISPTLQWGGYSVTGKNFVREFSNLECVSIGKDNTAWPGYNDLYTGLMPGTCNIKYTLLDTAYPASANISITVVDHDPVLPDKYCSIASSTGSNNFAPGDEADLFVVNRDGQPVDHCDITWDTNEPAGVCQIDQDGHLKILAPGTTTISTFVRYFCTDDTNWDPEDYGKRCYFTVNVEQSGIDGITAVESPEADIYTLSGILLRRGADADFISGLASGWYIKVTPAGSEKFYVK